MLRLGRGAWSIDAWLRQANNEYPPLRLCLWNSQAVYQGEGWLSIGFSDSGAMPGSDSVVGLPGDDTVLEYDMDGYSQPDEASLQARRGERVGLI